MILAKTNDVFESNMEPSKALSFSISDVGLVMEILSGLYKNPIQTLVQEYICNGRDAMREANTWGKLPMAISVPNLLEPTFKVRDFGVGISPDRMANIFVNYGSSTKRNTNTQTGGFGIGAKSVFSYTDSFTVVSFYNGKKYTYLAYMTREKGGCDLISTETTAEHNGVEITIAVKRESFTAFKDAVQRCVRYWKEDIVFRGVAQYEIEQRKPIVSLGKMNIYAEPKRTYSYTTWEAIFLIDGIQYDQISKTVGYRSNLFQPNVTECITTINLPNGYFKLSPSRESIIDTEDNVAKQGAIVRECENFIAGKVNEITLLPNIDDKLKMKSAYNSFVSIDRMSFKLDDHYSWSGNRINTSGVKVEQRVLYKSRRASKASVKTTYPSGFDITNTIVYTTNEPEPNTLAARLNYHLELNPNETLIILDRKIPHDNLIFNTILNSQDLPKPVRKKGLPKVKLINPRDAKVTVVDGNGSRSRNSVEWLNNSSAHFIRWESGMDLKLSRFYSIVEVPKCNESIIKKKLLTPKQALDKLLAREDEAVGFVAHLKLDTIDKLSKYNHKRDEELYRFLMQDKTSKVIAKQQKIDDCFSLLTDKCPLLRVYKSNRTYRQSITDMKVMTDAINQLLKGVKV